MEVSPTPEEIEAGALAIMNGRLRQAGVQPLDSLDLLFPNVLMEVMADSEAAQKALLLCRANGTPGHG